MQFFSWPALLISNPKKSAKSRREQNWHQTSRPIRPFLELLEDRLCPSVYNYDVVAQTGSTVNLPNSSTAAGTLTSMALASINDSGNVAFLGSLNNGYSGVDEGTFNAAGSVNLSVLSFTTRNFTFPQIDNQGEVIAQDQYLTGATLNSHIRTWQTNGTYGSGADAQGSLNGSSGTGHIVLHPAISADGTQFAYQDTSSGVLSLDINDSEVMSFPSGSRGPLRTDRRQRCCGRAGRQFQYQPDHGVPGRRVTGHDCQHNRFLRTRLPARHQQRRECGRLLRQPHDGRGDGAEQRPARLRTRNGRTWYLRQHCRSDSGTRRRGNRRRLQHFERRPRPQRDAQVGVNAITTPNGTQTLTIDDTGTNASGGAELYYSRLTFNTNNGFIDATNPATIQVTAPVPLLGVGDTIDDVSGAVQSITAASSPNNSGAIAVTLTSGSNNYAVIRIPTADIVVDSVSTTDSREAIVDYEITNPNLTTPFDIQLYRSDKETYSSSDTKNMPIGQPIHVTTMTPGKYTKTVDLKPKSTTTGASLWPASRTN